VISSNPVVNLFSDTTYVAEQIATEISLRISRLVLTMVAVLITLPKALLHPLTAIFGAKKTDHTHTPNQVVCERCIGTSTTSRFQFVDDTKENLLVVLRIIEWACEIFAIFVIGIVMIVLTFFPNIIRKKTDMERAEEDRLRARKDADHRRRIQEFQAWSEEQDEYFDEKLKEDERLRKYNLTATKVNSALDNNTIIDVGSDILADDQQVAKLNGALKAVRNNKEGGSDALQDIADELLKNRQAQARRDARRHKINADLREKEWNARQLLKDADSKAREGKYHEANDLAKKADGLMRDVNALYSEFHSV